MTSDDHPVGTFGSVVRHAARRWPSATIAFPDESAGFAQLDALGDDFGRRVLAAGARPGDKVGVLLEPRLEFIAALVGIARIGATVVPINERFKARELAYVIGHADLTVLLTTSRVADFVDFPALVAE